MIRPQLPPECILIIIRLFHNDWDTDTLARLLRVNKSVCALTLPFLYKDCFTIWMHHGRSPFRDEEPSRAQLVRTLLRQVHPQSRIPDLLKVAYLSQDYQTDLASMADPPPPPLFKYGEFLPIIDVYAQFNHSMFEFICNNSPLMDYVATNRLYEKYVDEGYIANNIRDECKDKVLELVLQIDIYRQLTWTLCQDHQETIEELIIPLKDVQRYIDCAHRFTSLSEVSFSGSGIGWNRRYMHTYDWNHRQIEQREFDRLIEGMIEFVRRHTSINKNVLRNVELPPPYQLYESDRYSRSDFYYGIQSHLPPLQNSRKMVTDWITLLARHTDTSLGHLESLRTTSDMVGRQEDVSKLLSRHPPILPRCRALKHLSVDALGLDMFQWAVLERKQKEAKQQQENILGQQLSSWHQSHHTSDLVPLQSIEISNKKPSPLGQELNDIAFAFSDSLEILSVRDGIRRSNIFVNQSIASQAVLHGQGWDLPRLRTLFFEMYDLKLQFDMDALQRSRALETLTMRDDMVTYRHRDIRAWSVVHLPQLKKLNLQGSPALHFNMGSLHHSPCLEELSLRMAFINPDDTFIFYRMPSPEELEREDTQGTDDHEPSGMPGSNQGYQSIERRPRYTWDWHLPNLQKLDLAAVFAFMFDFQWLQYLPNLQTLQLSILSSANRLHERHITLKDLLKSEHQQESDGDGSKGILSDRYISLPKLESIVLKGRWIFEKVLEILFLAVAPNLHKVDFGSDCTGCTLEECIISSRKMSQMKQMHLHMLSADDEIQRVGLVPRESLQDEQRKKMRVTFILDGRAFCDILGP
ncbi:MAG: hypothetical protein J3Q66DRAFT_367246 [Benniella sp.]|nr:MAG: hypothetical protein J3Q66DRAFT_367246 [Benniella sp.]